MSTLEKFSILRWCYSPVQLQEFCWDQQAKALNLSAALISPLNKRVSSPKRIFLCTEIYWVFQWKANLLASTCIIQQITEDLHMSEQRVPEHNRIYCTFLLESCLHANLKDMWGRYGYSMKFLMVLVRKFYFKILLPQPMFLCKFNGKSFETRKAVIRALCKSFGQLLLISLKQNMTLKERAQPITVSAINNSNHLPRLEETVNLYKVPEVSNVMPLMLTRVLILWIWIYYASSSQQLADKRLITKDETQKQYRLNDFSAFWQVPEKQENCGPSVLTQARCDEFDSLKQNIKSFWFIFFDTNHFLIIKTSHL